MMYLSVKQEYLLRCIRTRAGRCGYGLAECELPDVVPLVDAGLVEWTEGDPEHPGTYFRITTAGRKRLR